ncbi:MAG: thiamine phosphate synthase, partial [Chthoniobacterales bacterium]
LEDIRTAYSEVKTPIFCIGGIKEENLAEVLAAGARRIVIVSGWLNADDIAAAVASARSAFLNL